MEKYFTPEIHLALIKSLLQVLCNTLDENKIEYFVDGGTLLGAVRHRDVIPWDDDADIGILEKDFYKLSNVLKQIHNKTIVFEDQTYTITTSLEFNQWVPSTTLPELNQEIF